MGRKRKFYYSAFDNSHVIFVCDSNLKLLKSIPIVEDGIGTEQDLRNCIFMIFPWIIPAAYGPVERLYIHTIA